MRAYASLYSKTWDPRAYCAGAASPASATLVITLAVSDMVQAAEDMLECKSVARLC